MVALIDVVGDVVQPFPKSLDSVMVYSYVSPASLRSKVMVPKTASPGADKVTEVGAAGMGAPLSGVIMKVAVLPEGQAAPESALVAFS